MTSSQPGRRPPQLVAQLGRGVLGPASSDRPALVSADDTGLTRGDGCFDATRVVTGPDGTSRAEQLDAHLARLARSASALDLPGVDRPVWAALVAEALARWEIPGEAVLKLIVTRGDESAPGEPTGLLTLTPLPPAAVEDRAGIPVVTLDRGHPADAFQDASWLLGGVKSLSYAVCMAAKREAARRGARDVLFISTDGYALEAPTAALLVQHGRRLSTTPTEGTGVLASITAGVVLDAARGAGLLPEHRLMTPAEVVDSDGAWLISSVRGVAPIDTLDGRIVPRDPNRDAVITRLAGFDPSGTA